MAKITNYAWEHATSSSGIFWPTKYITGQITVLNGKIYTAMSAGGIGLMAAKDDAPATACDNQAKIGMSVSSYYPYWTDTCRMRAKEITLRILPPIVY
jgi:hypothetical protein